MALNERPGNREVNGYAARVVVAPWMPIESCFPGSLGKPRREAKEPGALPCPESSEILDGR